MSLPEPIEDALVAQVVALSMASTSVLAISNALNIGRKKVRKIQASEAFKKECEELADTARRNALAVFKGELDALAPLAYQALKHNLEQNKIEAVKVFAQLVGAVHQADPDAGKDAGGLTIIMPGAVAPMKDVTKETEIK